MNEYTKILQENFISPSIQRVSVLRYLDVHRTHPTVEQIYSCLKNELPTLSKTTVYNVLELLESKRIIKAISGSDGREHYDFDRRAHSHFKCLRCGRVFDVDVDYVYRESQEINGHRVDDYNLLFKGVCKECLAKDKQGRNNA